MKKRQKHIEEVEDICAGLRCKRRRQRRLSLEEKVDIAYRAIVMCESQKDLAIEYRVSQVVVSVLVSKVRKKPKLLADLISERTDKRQQEHTLAEFINAKIAAGIQLRTVKQVRDDNEAATSISLKEHQVRQVMKTDVGLSYKKIVRLAPRANSIENLISR